MIDQILPKFRLLFWIKLRNRSLIPHQDQPIFAALTIFLMQAPYRNVIYEKKFRHPFDAQSIREPQHRLDPSRTPAIRGSLVSDISRRYSSSEIEKSVISNSNGELTFPNPSCTISIVRFCGITQPQFHAFSSGTGISIFINVSSTRQKSRVYFTESKLRYLDTRKSKIHKPHVEINMAFTN